MISLMNHAWRVKIFVTASIISFVVLTIFALQFFLNLLLEREAFTVGMRWALSVERNLDELDQIFEGKESSVKNKQWLNQISSFGHVYHYEFKNNNDAIVYSMGSYKPGLNQPTKQPASNHIHHLTREV